jgi:hypothetical protein
MFSIVLLTAPFVVLGDSGQVSGVFGLDPDLVKLGFFLLFTYSVWSLNRSIEANTKNNNVLFANQRELTRCLTQLTTMHCINHPGQIIEVPKITGEENG